MTRLPWAGAFLAALLATSCGAALQKLPAGPGAPATDADDAFAQATAACRSLTSITAELSVSGRAGGQRLRGRVLAGLAAPASAYLDAAAPFGASLFIYAARDAEATLHLPRDQRVLRHGDPATVLEAVTGLALGAADLRRTLTACPPEDAPSAGRAFGTSWRAVTLSSVEAYMQRASSGAPWHVVALVHHGAADRSWRAEYTGYQADLPRSIRLFSGTDGSRFDLRIALSQVELNPQLEPEVFDLRIPESASPISLDELRQSGPLGESAGPRETTGRSASRPQRAR